MWRLWLGVLADEILFQNGRWDSVKFHCNATDFENNHIQEKFRDNLLNTVQCCYTGVSFLQNHLKRHPIARPFTYAVKSKGHYCIYLILPGYIDDSGSPSLRKVITASALSFLGTLMTLPVLHYATTSLRLPYPSRVHWWLCQSSTTQGHHCDYLILPGYIDDSASPPLCKVITASYLILPGYIDDSVSPPLRKVITATTLSNLSILCTWCVSHGFGCSLSVYHLKSHI